MGLQMQSHGIQSMLKEGHRHLSGLDEAVLKNVEACKALSIITRTSLGPNGISLFFSLHSPFVINSFRQPSKLNLLFNLIFRTFFFFFFEWNC